MNAHALVDAPAAVLAQLAGFVSVVLGLLMHRWGVSRGVNLGDKGPAWARAARLARPGGYLLALLGALLFGAGWIVR